MTAWCESCEKPVSWNCRGGVRLTDQQCPTCGAAPISLAEAKRRLGVIYRGDDYVLPIKGVTLPAYEEEVQ